LRVGFVWGFGTTPLPTGYKATKKLKNFKTVDSPNKINTLLATVN